MGTSSENINNDINSIINNFYKNHFNINNLNNNSNNNLTLDYLKNLNNTNGNFFEIISKRLLKFQYGNNADGSSFTINNNNRFSDFFKILNFLKIFSNALYKIIKHSEINEFYKIKTVKIDNQPLQQAPTQSSLSQSTYNLNNNILTLYKLTQNTINTDEFTYISSEYDNNEYTYNSASANKYNPNASTSQDIIQNYINFALSLDKQNLKEQIYAFYFYINILYYCAVYVNNIEQLYLKTKRIRNNENNHTLPPGSKLCSNIDIHLNQIDIHRHRALNDDQNVIVKVIDICPLTFDMHTENVFIDIDKTPENDYVIKYTSNTYNISSSVFNLYREQKKVVSVTLDAYYGSNYKCPHISNIFKDADLYTNKTIIVTLSPKPLTEMFKEYKKLSVSLDNLNHKIEHNKKAVNKLIKTNKEQKKVIDALNIKVYTYILIYTVITILYLSSIFFQKRILYSVIIFAIVIILNIYNNSYNNDYIEHFVESKGPVIVYSGNDFQGNNVALGVGSYDLYNQPFPNDSINSIKIDDGYEVTLWGDYFQGGGKITLNGSENNLGRYGFAYAASSYNVVNTLEKYQVIDTREYFGSDNVVKIDFRSFNLNKLTIPTNEDGIINNISFKFNLILWWFVYSIPFHFEIYDANNVFKNDTATFNQLNNTDYNDVNIDFTGFQNPLHRKIYKGGKIIFYINYFSYSLGCIDNDPNKFFLRIEYATQLSNNNKNPNDVILYTRENYEGSYLTYKTTNVGLKNLNDLVGDKRSIFYQKIRSIHIPNGIKVILYDANGASLTFKSSKPDLNAYSFLDSTVSLDIENNNIPPDLTDNYIQLFTEKNFKGETSEIAIDQYKGIHNIIKFSFANNQLNSIIIPKNKKIRVTLYDNINGYGNSYIINGSEPDLYNFANKTVSLKIETNINYTENFTDIIENFNDDDIKTNINYTEKFTDIIENFDNEVRNNNENNNGVVSLHSGSNFDGSQKLFNIGVYNISNSFNNDGLKNSIKSLKVNAGYKITFYKKNNNNKDIKKLVFRGEKRNNDDPPPDKNNNIPYNPVDNFVNNADIIVANYDTFKISRIKREFTCLNFLDPDSEVNTSDNFDFFIDQKKKVMYDSIVDLLRTYDYYLYLINASSMLSKTSKKIKKENRTYQEYEKYYKHNSTTKEKYIKSDNIDIVIKNKFLKYFCILYIILSILHLIYSIVFTQGFYFILIALIIIMICIILFFIIIIKPVRTDGRLNYWLKPPKNQLTK